MAQPFKVSLSPNLQKHRKEQAPTYHQQQQLLVIKLVLYLKAHLVKILFYLKRYKEKNIAIKASFIQCKTDNFNPY